MVVLTACAAEGRAEPVALDVTVQTCDMPTQSHGFGALIAQDVVVTAGHTVEGDLRSLTVDGEAAEVIALDRRLDLALLRVDVDADVLDLSTEPAETARLLGAGRGSAIDIVKTATLIVHDATDEQRYERIVHTIAPGVAGGTSGAPVVDDEGRVLGIVVLDDRGRDVAYAVAAAEITALLDRAGTETLARPGTCA